MLLTRDLYVQQIHGAHQADPMSRDLSSAFFRPSANILCPHSHRFLKSLNQVSRSCLGLSSVFHLLPHFSGFYSIYTMICQHCLRSICDVHFTEKEIEVQAC